MAPSLGSQMRVLLFFFFFFNRLIRKCNNCRYEEQSAVVDGEVVRRRVGTTGKEDWYKKRMSRSFDDETLANMLEEDNSSRRMISREDLAPLPLDDVLKQSEVLAR